jgi:hypothetical protein
MILWCRTVCYFYLEVGRFFGASPLTSSLLASHTISMWNSLVHRARPRFMQNKQTAQKRRIVFGDFD